MPFLSEHVRQSQASPSISLEKGAYRLRNSNRSVAKPQPTPLRRRANSRTAREPPALRYEKQMAVLIVFLICATVTCFGAAYYLFTTRWDYPIRPASRTHPSNASFGLQVIDLRSTLSEPQAMNNVASGHEEKYLAYMPHSGFHNQRIAFENAVVLARLLNRTLLVPPVRLGNNSLYYAPFEALQEMLVLSDKTALQHCRPLIHDLDMPEECTDFGGYMHIPWDWLVDLSNIQRHQKLVSRWNFTHEWLRDVLHIDNEDIFLLADTSRDTYGFQDFDPLSTISSVARKYQHMIHLSTLAFRDEKLVHLGSLFGSSRLHLRDDYSINVRKLIRRDMAHLNPLLINIAASIQRSLGDVYLGAHVRLGDGIFQENAIRNSRLVWWKIVHGVLGFSTEDTVSLERRFADDENFADFNASELALMESNETGLATSLWPNFESSQAPPATLCKGRFHRSQSLRHLNVPLYISSDVVDSRTNSYLSLFTRTFPCTFFLSDFANYTAPLDGLQSSVDGLFLKPFLLPFVDALVAARGARVAGTEGSTYSRFVEDVLWRVYHGYDIVQKG